MGYVIASRKSDLARLQALTVGAALKKKFPKDDIEYHFRQSLGDINLKDPLWKRPEKGVFTEDFRQGLIDGEWDMVVHSWKDLPIEQEPGTEIVATLPRADMRDFFLCKKSSLERIQASGELRVFTSSPRRMYNLEGFFKNYLPFTVNKLEFSSVRGNVPTRIEKTFADPDIDGLILAKAALDRLLQSPQEEFVEVKAQLRSRLEACQWMVLPLRVNPNAAAQGALAIEISSQRPDLKEVCQQIHCEETWQGVVVEREVLRSYGGGCHQKIGVSVLQRSFGQLLIAQGEQETGEIIDRLEVSPETGEDTFLPGECFPQDLSASSWFERKAVSYVRPSGTNHFVARANSLPENEKPLSEELLWVSGNKTWQRLAQRGLWVNGSCESLGESESMRLEALGNDLPWCKWTHIEGVQKKDWQNVASYELVAKSSGPDLSGKKNFFWMSGSSFKLAVEQYPQILAATHYCGPGNTLNLIEKQLAAGGQGGVVKVALDYDHWKKKTWKTTNS